MKKSMIIITCILLPLWLICAVLDRLSPGGAWLSLAITFGTMSYHFLMRFAVGGAVDAIFHDRMNYRRRWFAPKHFEAPLYKALGVKSWKKHMPTYSPDTFSLEHHTLEEIVQATCQSEVVHEIIALLSLVPIAFTAVWGEFWVFLLTSIAAALFDLSFVIMQRYNRPRLIKMLERANRKENTYDS